MKLMLKIFVCCVVLQAHASDCSFEGLDGDAHPHENMLQEGAYGHAAKRTKIQEHTDPDDYLNGSVAKNKDDGAYYVTHWITGRKTKLTDKDAQKYKKKQEIWESNTFQLSEILKDNPYDIDEIERLVDGGIHPDTALFSYNLLFHFKEGVSKRHAEYNFHFPARSLFLLLAAGCNPDVYTKSYETGSSIEPFIDGSWDIGLASVVNDTVRKWRDSLGHRLELEKEDFLEKQRVTSRDMDRVALPRTPLSWATRGTQTDAWENKSTQTESDALS